MAVDPAYFRHGYGTKLCKHGMAIAKGCGQRVGVIAAEKGFLLYSKLGFHTSVKITVTDVREGKEASVDFWVQAWDPRKGDLTRNDGK